MSAAEIVPEIEPKDLIGRFSIGDVLMMETVIKHLDRQSAEVQAAVAASELYKALMPYCGATAIQAESVQPPLYLVK